MTAIEGTRVLIVEPRALLAESLAAGLRDRGVHRVDTHPDIVLVGLHGDLLTERSPIASFAATGLPVVALIDGLDLDRLALALSDGATAVLTTDRSLDDLAAQLVSASSGNPAIGRSPAVPRLRDHDPAEAVLEGFGALTTSEEAVLVDLMRGHAPEEISRDRFVALSTVRSQIRSILSKLGVNSQLAAVTLAFRSGWQEVREIA